MSAKPYETSDLPEYEEADDDRYMVPGDFSWDGDHEVLERIRATHVERDALRAFKKFVHDRLDKMGVPSEFPDGVHTKEGCRIGDRLDWVEKFVKSGLLRFGATDE